MSKVYLIGTGPGDEELLTIKAVRVLKECTAVMYDRLGALNIFKYINDDCKVYYCGKEPGSHYKTQDEINDMLVTLAKEGHIVGRVKGGDPYVFGRGGEETLRLFEENIPFEVVPGITSPISVLNYAGIPITHRGLAQSFHVYTGMSAHKLNINWEAAVRGGGTLVFLMGLENLEYIIENLKKSGIEDNMPAAVIMRGTTSKQKKVIGNVEDIVIKAREEGLKSPCIIVVGKVVELSEKLSWYEEKPLFGLNICVTRSKEQSFETSIRLKELGADVTEINSIEILKTPHNLNNYLSKLKEYEYIIFTSQNSANIFFDFLIENKYDIRNIKAKLMAIGGATEKSLNQRGLTCIKGEDWTGEGLLREIKKEVKKGDKVLIPGSFLAKETIFEGLKEMDILVDKVDTYEPIIPNNINKNSFKEVDIVIFTSPSTVKNMISIFGDEIKEKKCIAIGPITQKELLYNNIPSITCKEQSIDGIIEMIRGIKNV